MDPAVESGAVDPVADDTVTGPPAKEYGCLRCGHAWNRNQASPKDPGYRPRACPSCHSAYWETAAVYAHGRRPKIDVAADRRARQSDATIARRKRQLTRLLYSLGPEESLAVVRAHAPIAALLEKDEAELVRNPTIMAPEPQRVIIEVRQAEPLYPWQGGNGRIDLESAAPIIPPPPSVTSLPQFSVASLSEPSPEEVVARREP